MNPYGAAFVMFLYQVAVGGLVGLSATPFNDLERGFYKSTAGVLVVAAVLALWGQIDILPEESGVRAVLGVLLLAVFTLFLLLYFVSLWGERGFLRARFFSTAILTGLAGLMVASYGFSGPSLGPVEAVFLPLSFVVSALLLGAVTVGMLIGHWYLIETGQSLDPFFRVFRFFVVMLVIQTGLEMIGTALLYLFGTAATEATVERLFSHHLVLLSSRFLVAQAAPLALSWMIWKTLTDFKNTMAATGLFYIALLGVFVGELLSSHILVLAGGTAP
ncbi:MAG: hypothetical protein OXU42_10235 [Deltaproteobacteria bacterium]|nr:hypothetical protein [Deltaproteobacteria bacterium]